MSDEIKTVEPNDVIEAIIRTHIHRLVINGIITVNKPSNPRDISRYLQSGEFMRYQQEVRMEVAGQMLLPEPPEKKYNI